MTSDPSLPETGSQSWRKIRMRLERLLAEVYSDRLEISRILDAASIDSVNVRTDLSPLTTWNYIIRSFASAPHELKRLLEAVQEDYPNDAIVLAALEMLESSLDQEKSISLEFSSQMTGSRASLLSWLQNHWRNSGPCICCLQGFSGVGKTHTANLLMASGAFQKSAFVEIPEGRTSFQDFLLLVSESLDRDIDSRLTIGGDMASQLERVLIDPLLLVVDEFQNCLEPNGSPLVGFEDLFNGLRIGRHRGRILLLSSRAIDEDNLEGVSVRTIGGLTNSEGVYVFAEMLAQASRESEVPEDLVDDVVSWLGGNPRALKTLVAGLKHFSLDELIELDPAIWEMRNSRMNHEMISRLERKIVSKNYAAITAEEQGAVRRLSVHRRSFKFEAVEAAVASTVARTIINTLIDNFLVERRRNWYSLNTIVREVMSVLITEDRAGYVSAHRAAANYYMRPFRSNRATASRNAVNFIEARHHLMAIDDLRQFADIAKLYALHLERIFDRKTPIPENREELSQQIVTLESALFGGSPSSDLHYYLARLFLARNEAGDRARATDELREAIKLPRCAPDAWSLLLELGEFEMVLAALKGDSVVAIASSQQIYLKLGQALIVADRRDEAITLLCEGITRIGPEHSVFSLYRAAAELMTAADRRDEAITLLREGIARLGPEHNVFSLYQAAAELMAAAGRRDEAIALLCEGIARFGPGHSVFSLYQAAAELMAAADHRDEAITLLREGIAYVGPEHNVFSLYQAAAGLMAAAGRRDEAITLLREGIARVGPEHSVSSLYQAAAELMAAAGRRDEAITLLREGIARVGPEHNVFSLYLAAAELMTAAGRRDEAITILDQGIDRYDGRPAIRSLLSAKAKIYSRSGDHISAIGILVDGISRANFKDETNGRLAEQALFIAYGLQSERVLRETTDKLSSFMAKSRGTSNLARVLLLQLHDDWQASVSVQADRGDFSYAPILGLQAFSWLCMADPSSAGVVADELQVRSTNLMVVSWLKALIAYAGGDSQGFSRHLEACLGRPLTVDELDDNLLWIRFWAKDSREFSPQAAFYFPRLPAVLTGLPTDITLANISTVLPSVGD